MYAKQEILMAPANLREAMLLANEAELQKEYDAAVKAINAKSELLNRAIFLCNLFVERLNFTPIRDRYTCPKCKEDAIKAATALACLPAHLLPRLRLTQRLAKDICSCSRMPVRCATFTVTPR